MTSLCRRNHVRVSFCARLGKHPSLDAFAHDAHASASYADAPARERPRLPPLLRPPDRTPPEDRPPLLAIARTLLLGMAAKLPPPRPLPLRRPPLELRLAMTLCSFRKDWRVPPRRCKTAPARATRGRRACAPGEGRAHRKLGATEIWKALEKPEGYHRAGHCCAVGAASADPTTRCNYSLDRETAVTGTGSGGAY